MWLGAGHGFPWVRLPSSYSEYDESMTIERVTVSLPKEVRDAAQRVAEGAGLPFSTVVAEALASYVRGRLADAWLAEHEAVFGQFSEDELRLVAEQAGVPYVPPATGRAQAGRAAS